MSAYQLIKGQEIVAIDGTTLAVPMTIGHIGYDAKSVAITATNGDMVWLWNNTPVVTK
ncbi:MAG TPA: hypothetical protein VJW23_15440 [Propionibacteriaceae bacterium]|nr:hypothetical protein [Propionibacteriaceae bacterium]